MEKDVKGAIGIIITVTLCIIAIISTCLYFVIKNNAQNIALQIKCKEAGAQMVYENYSWICK